jgi:hypothetical protein
MRKFGESVMYIAQFPTQTSSEKIKNTGVRIAYRISWTSDLNMLADPTNLSSELARCLGQLGAGQTIINVVRSKNPVLVNIVSDVVRESLRQVPD